MTFNKTDRKYLLSLARDAIASYLEKRPLSTRNKKSEFLKKRGCFITLKTQKNYLRGCIGIIISDKSLHQNIIEYAIHAAVNDSRFSPVTFAELGNLKISISILSTPELLSSYQECKIGKDGIIIECDNKRAVFLPEVSVENGWDLKTYFMQLCRKATLKKDAYLRKDAKLEKFTTESFGE